MFYTEPLSQFYITGTNRTQKMTEATDDGYR